jgi:hypothetical protein
MALWDSPRQREAYNWLTAELANLRSAFRWAADHGDLDVAVPIATYASVLGLMIENYEPIAWAEEMIGPARAADHPGLASLYAMVSWCYVAGRLEEAVRYGDAGQIVVASRPDGVYSGFEAWLGSVHNLTGHPARTVEWCRRLLAHSADPYAVSRSGLVVALMRAGAQAEAMAVAKELLGAAADMTNPWALSYVFLTYGMACCDTDPLRARDAMRQGVVIAQNSGNRWTQTHLANILGRLEARHGDKLAAFDHLALAVRNYHDSGNTTVMRVPLAALAALLDSLGRDEPAATIAGFAFNPVTRAWLPELTAAITHLRDVLGDRAYESLSRRGKNMTTVEMVTYAYDQIDQARAELNAVPS